LYATRKAAENQFHAYNRPGGFYERVKTGWGTYFRRMTAYKGRAGTVNQLDKIIAAIRKRESTSTAAYTVVIQQPGGETIRPLGGPCLNYVALQLEPANEDHPMTLGLLAVYRNHDFLERAYGNYWGLSNLLLFLAAEVEAAPGPLTCVSSHAYVASKRAALRTFVGTL
jgi:thymidylate synthase